ncbi:unnamed protein product [Colias eurytheme]|nr:unnamed protein product [Colias eurytheme]
MAGGTSSGPGTRWMFSPVLEYLASKLWEFLEIPRGRKRCRVSIVDRRADSNSVRSLADSIDTLRGALSCDPQSERFATFLSPFLLRILGVYGERGGERRRCAGAVSRGMRPRPLLLLLLLALLRAHGLLATSGGESLCMFVTRGARGAVSENNLEELTESNKNNLKAVFERASLT